MASDTETHNTEDVKAAKRYFERDANWLEAVACQHGRTLVSALDKEQPLLARCREALAIAAYSDDGLDMTDAEPLITAIGGVLGDADDYEASLKCSDDPCERCGKDGICHVIKIARAKYDGVCDACWDLHRASQPAPDATSDA